MNRLQNFKKRYVELVDENINFDKTIIYSVYDFLNHNVDYKNKKYFHVRIIIQYILNLDNSTFEFVKSICGNSKKLYGKEQSLYKDIAHYIKKVPVGEMLNEYLVLERKRKIKNILDSIE